MTALFWKGKGNSASVFSDDPEILLAEVSGTRENGMKATKGRKVELARWDEMKLEIRSRDRYSQGSTRHCIRKVN